MSGRIVTNVLATVRHVTRDPLPTGDIRWVHTLGGTIDLAGKLSLRAMLRLCRSRMRPVVFAAPRATASAEQSCPLFLLLTRWCRYVYPSSVSAAA
jgi:hypothetical protein